MDADGVDDLANPLGGEPRISAVGGTTSNRLFRRSMLCQHSRTVAYPGVVP